MDIGETDTFALYSYAFEPITGYYPVMFYSADIQVANYTLSVDLYGDLLIQYLTPLGNPVDNIVSALIGSNLNDYLPELPDYSNSDFAFVSWRYFADGLYYDLSAYSLMPASSSRVVLTPFYAYSSQFLAQKEDEWYKIGYDAGADIGYKNGYAAGHRDGYIEGQKYQDTQVIKTSASWFAGLAQGKSEGGNYSFLNLFSAILDAPVRALFGYTTVENGVNVTYPGLFSFEVFGVDLSSLYLSVFSACIVFCVLRMVL